MRRAATGLVAIGAVLLSGPPAVALPPVETPDVAPRAMTGAPDEVSVSAAAREAGHPVEVAAARTERSRLFVNPDGSRTWEGSAVPRWTRRPGGDWVPVDTTLRRAGGRISPAATSFEVEFSAGGGRSLASVAADGRELALAVPWELPVPVLDGPHATYPEVLPGVDLVVTARPDGFAEVLVIKDRRAAAHPDLAALHFAVTTSGLSVRPEAGGFVAVDGSGEVVFTSPVPKMWDSSGGVDRQADWPSEGDRVTEVTATVGPDEVVLSPDQTWLDDPATVYPIYLDPSVSGSRNEWVMISSGWPDERYHNFDGSSDEGMGLCQVSVESSCERNQIKRLAWEFGLPSTLHGSRVLEATFSAYETYAYSCTAKSVELWLVGGISSSTTWRNHSDDWMRELASVDVARKRGCSLGPGRVEFNATSAAAEFARKRWPSLTLGLRASNESSMTEGWKRFRNDATLSVTYNSPPTTPTGLGVASAGCATGASRPVLGTATPALRATVNDPNTETDLRLNLAWERWTGSAWSAHGSGTVNNLRNNQPGSYPIGSGLTHGGIYRFQAQTVDPWSHEGHSGTDPSGWSGYCEFEVDTVAPAAAPAVSSPVYGTDLNQFYGSVGLTADFSFSAAGVTDVSAYQWGWADPPTTEVATAALGGGVTVPLTPPPPFATDSTSGGLLTLYVRSVDRAGNRGPIARYAFNVGSASYPVGWWQLDEPVGATTLADSSGNGHDATATGVTMGAPGRLIDGPTVASFSGTDSGAATSGPVVRTDRSFTVSAWVRLASKGAWATILTQRGNRTGALVLQYDPHADRWVFAAHQPDDDNSTKVQAMSSAAPVAGMWTHLVGVYDAGAKQLRLYVNGVLQATVSHPGAWNATGPLLFGQEWHEGSMISRWRGDITDVRVWDRVLPAGEIAPMAATMVGRWRLDGDGLDATAWGRDANPSGVSWAADRAGNPASAAALDGSSAALTTTGPVFRTDQGFTVSAWARPTAQGGLGQPAVSQDGAVVSGFYLGYRTDAGPQWAMMMRSTDATTSRPWRAAGGTVTLNRWTHLVGVYDPAAGQVRVYVDGALVAASAAGQAWHASGSLAIGRWKWGSPVDWWPGNIDDVRVYQGVLPDSEISRLYQQ